LIKEGVYFILNAFLVEFMDLWGLWGFVIEKMLVFWGWVFWGALVFFGCYPYIAMTIFIVGSALRYDRDQYTWKADSSQLLRKKGMSRGSHLFHVGIILLFFGHFVGLLTPEWVYHPFMSAATKQIMAMIAGGVFGTMCLVGMLILLNRRLFDKRISKTSKFSDTFILLYLFA
jgi:nitrate reductase gamma subunit